MELSVCLIARNEENNLPRALASVAGLADELVVIDTGSTDRTVEIAQGFGAAVGSFAWCDDFSAARNAAIERATGDWILWLDADEELLPPSRRQWREMLHRKGAMGYFVARQDLLDADNPNCFTEMWQLRFFRRRDDLRFVGRCHPDFRPPLTVVAEREGKSVPYLRCRLTSLRLRRPTEGTQAPQSGTAACPGA